MSKALSNSNDNIIILDFGRITISSSVLTIDSNFFSSCSSFQILHIPPQIQSIDLSAFDNCDMIKKILVDDNNLHFSSENGILYTKNKETLLRYPLLMNEEHFTVPICVNKIANSAFYNCLDLKTVTIQSNVEFIGDSAFANCFNLEYIFVDDNNPKFVSIDGVLYTKDLKTLICYPTNKSNSIFTINSTVITISHYAFSDKLTSIVLPEGLISIGKSAFSNCTGLESIRIPASVMFIGDLAFYNSHFETFLIDPENPNFISVGGVLFTKDCKKLIAYPARLIHSDYEIPSTVTSIDRYAFSDCINLQYVKIPNGVESINEYTFFKCAKLANIDLPSTVVVIGDFAFSRCDALTLITIPSSTSIIGTKAFYKCQNLESITISAKVTSIGYGAFQRCPNLLTIQVDEGNSRFTSRDGILFSKNCQMLICYPPKKADEVYIVPDGVISIDSYAFSCNPNLKTITIPSSVVSMGKTPYFKCDQLEQIIVEPNNPSFISIDGILFTKDIGTLLCFPSSHHIAQYTIPSTVCSIDDSAFYSCCNLKSIAIPSSVASIGRKAFELCKNLEQIVTIDPSSLNFISTSAFSYCARLSSIVLPSIITTIPNSVFGYCRWLSTIVIPSTVTAICDSAFKFCYSLSQIVIPSSVTSIGNSAFACCVSLKQIVIPSRVTSIGSFAFAYCSELKTASIPSSVATIGHNAFVGCSQLQHLSFLANIKSISDSTFSDCINLQHIIIPPTVISIGKAAFFQCCALKSINIPIGVKFIEDDAFSYCSDLHTIIIPSSVLAIAPLVFSYCQIFELSVPTFEQIAEE